MSNCSVLALPYRPTTLIGVPSSLVSSVCAGSRRWPIVRAAAELTPAAALPKPCTPVGVPPDCAEPLWPPCAGLAAAHRAGRRGARAGLVARRIVPLPCRHPVLPPVKLPPIAAGSTCLIDRPHSRPALATQWPCCR